MILRTIWTLAILLTSVLGKAQQNPLYIAGSFGFHTVKEDISLGSPTSAEVASKRYSFQAKLYLMNKTNQDVGLKVLAGFYTMGIDDDELAESLTTSPSLTTTVSSKVRVNPMILVGPAIFMAISENFSVSIEPTVGLVGATRPDFTVTYSSSSGTTTETRTRKTDKIGFGYSLGVGLNQMLGEKLRLSFTADYFSGKSEFTNTFVSGSTNRQTGGVENKYNGMMFAVGIGTRLQ